MSDNLHYPDVMDRSESFYYYPIFTTYRNDVPLNRHASIIEAEHVYDLYYCYADRHNNHLSSYSEWHPDPLERRIHQHPDVDAFSLTGNAPLWYLGIDTSHALHGAYRHALQVFGDALQPVGWNRREPWLEYNFADRLAELGMPYIPKPISFYQSVYHAPYESFGELQRRVHHNNFYAMCLIAIAYIVNAVKMNHYHNLAHAGYMRGSPGFVSAHRYWCRLNGYAVLDRSEDEESTADFELIAEEQRESLDALVPAAPPIPLPPPQEDLALPSASDRAFNAADWQVGAPRRSTGNDSFASIDPELLRDLLEGGDDLDIISNFATTDSPPVALSNFLAFDVYDLIERLQEVSDLQRPSEPTGWGNDTTEPAWEWPTEPAPAEAPAMGPPVWPSAPQQSTPPLNWEDYWSTMRGERITQANIESSGQLIDYIVSTHPAA
ncbi:hypothetical protein RSOLAG22IIIB_11604 [Rhizoctonia solani]|uniref:Uncharacterized protein n=1 Tax=Rhizoctonia solani TaxID=456999 RepID=A0A0K6G9T2_9AGAM|nr:hypothetical protein RSOLAG22IIIB_11604 [Rhizoctonia solani]